MVRLFNVVSGRLSSVTIEGAVDELYGLGALVGVVVVSGACSPSPLSLSRLHSVVPVPVLLVRCSIHSRQSVAIVAIHYVIPVLLFTVCASCY